MSDGEQAGETQAQQTVTGQPVVDPSQLPPASPGTSPLEADHAGAAEHGDAGRPEIAVAGAFIGAFVFAKLLKRFGGGDE